MNPTTRHSVLGASVLALLASSVLSTQGLVSNIDIQWLEEDVQRSRTELQTMTERVRRAIRAVTGRPGWATLPTTNRRVGEKHFPRGRSAGC